MKKRFLALFIIISLFIVGCSEIISEKTTVQEDPVGIEEEEEKINEKISEVKAEPEIIEETIKLPTTVIEESVIKESVKEYSLDLTIKPIPSKYSEMEEYLPKYGEVFGIPFFASEKSSDNKLLHAMNVLAQYLDNNEDGIPDNTLVIDILLKERVGIMMFKNEDETENSGIWDSDLPLDKLQELRADETIISGNKFDASLEEILHLITDIGYEGVYPSVFGEFTDSQLANLMDKARGGHFEEDNIYLESHGESGKSAVPSSYPSSAWYSYEDETCSYSCMNTEYIYWALTSILGAQKDRCGEIKDEWKLCTKELVKEKDPKIFALLTDPKYKFPTILPDGKYKQ